MKFFLTRILAFLAGCLLLSAAGCSFILNSRETSNNPPPQISETSSPQPSPTLKNTPVLPATREATVPPPTVTPALTPTSPWPEAKEPYIGIWISREELDQLPLSGSAWEQLKVAADRELGAPDLSDINYPHNVHILAKALVYARTGEENYRREVIEHLMAAIGTEDDGTTLGLSRNLVAYVIAADLVNLPEDRENDRTFREWLQQTMTEDLQGLTLRSTQEQRPNNWGTHAGASRAAAALYLDDAAELERSAMVFRGWLGNREAYSEFSYGELHWQADPDSPVGINPKGATKEGHSIDGALPEEMRRGGKFRWPPRRTNYPWGALQGALVQAEILSRAGYPAWGWECKALLRAAEFLHDIGWEAEGDDEWQLWILNRAYGTNFPAPSPATPGKNMGWTDWTHSEHRPPPLPYEEDCPASDRDTSLR
jgi:hypothetical protein